MAYHTAITVALYQHLYPEFIVNSFDIKRAAATFAQIACTLHGKHKVYVTMYRPMLRLLSRNYQTNGRKSENQMRKPANDSCTYTSPLDDVDLTEGLEPDCAAFLPPGGLV